MTTNLLAIALAHRGPASLAKRSAALDPLQLTNPDNQTKSWQFHRVRQDPTQNTVAIVLVAIAMAWPLNSRRVFQPLFQPVFQMFQMSHACCKNATV